MTFLKNLSIVLLMTFCFLPLGAQDNNAVMEGSWQGALDLGAIELRIIFNLSLNEEQAWKATMDSPDQGSMGIPLGEVRITADSVRIEAPNLLGYYIGIRTSPTTLEGEWHQAGREFKLDLEKKEGAFILSRPQEPQPPYPYREEELVFPSRNRDFSLAATLSLPEGRGPFPAVVLISGSGSQNRDEEIFGHKPFKVIADHLTRTGIAVLRYDDRGAGASGGNAAGATTEDLAGDARAALDYMFTRNDIDNERIGIIGHSEGGMIAFLLASSHNDIAFVVSLAGPGVDGKKILLDQSEKITRLSGVAETVLEDNRNIMSGIYDIMIARESYVDWKAETIDFIEEFYNDNPSATYSGADIENIKETLIASIPGPSYAWMRYFVMSDPAPLFALIGCPVLALNGEKDCQVLPEENLNAIKTGLVRAGNAEFETRILPGLNHLFQNCETGLPAEYGLIEETFDPGTLDLIDEWIWKQVRQIQ